MGQRSLLNAGSNPAGLNGYSPLELLKDSSMATFLRQGPLTQQRMADASAFDRNSELANMMRQHGTVSQQPSALDRSGDIASNLFYGDTVPPKDESILDPQYIPMKGAPQKYDGVGMDLVMPAITAFHGSPHKFSKFDMSKIGTGEGAQAYGHGLYFAENQKVANEYADKLATLKGQSVNLDGIDIKKMAHYSDEPSYIKGVEKKYNKGVAEVVKQIQDEGYRTTRDTLYSHKEDLKGAVFPTHGYDSYEDLLSRYVFAEHKISENLALNRNLYKVDIPDDQIAKMLDWDKPFTEQPKLVQDKLKELIPESYLDDMSDKYNVNLSLEGMTGDELYQTVKMAGADDYTPHLAEEYTRALRDDERASMTLKKLGIPGIKYYDQASRHQAGNTYTSGELTKVRGRWQGIVNSSDGGFETVFGDTKEATRLAQEAMIKARRPTRNFVAFDDQLPTIESINDQPLGLIHGR